MTGTTNKQVERSEGETQSECRDRDRDRDRGAVELLRYDLQAYQGVKVQFIVPKAIIKYLCLFQQHVCAELMDTSHVLRCVDPLNL